MTVSRSQPNIVEQLHDLADLLHPENTKSDAGFHRVCDLAADEIESLRQKLEFAEFEWNRATEGMQERDAQLATWKLAVQVAEADLTSARKALEDIGEFCSGDQSTLGAVVRLGRIQSVARAALKDLAP